MANYKEGLAKLRDRLAKMREVGEAKLQIGIQAIEVTATAGALEYLRGRYPSEDKDGNKTDELSIMGIPVALMVGLGFHALGLVGATGKYSEHAHNVGTGALAAYAGGMAHTMGKKNAEEASSTPRAAGYPQAAALPSPGINSPFAQSAPRHAFAY